MFTLLVLQVSGSHYDPERGRAFALPAVAWCPTLLKRSGMGAPIFSGIAVWSGKSADHCFSTGSAALAWAAKPRKTAAKPRKITIPQAAIFFMTGALICRREHDRSLRHQRLSLDLIAGDYKNMGCRGELTSRRGKKVLGACSTRCRRRTQTDAPAEPKRPTREPPRRPLRRTPGVRSFSLLIGESAPVPFKRPTHTDGMGFRTVTRSEVSNLVQSAAVNGRRLEMCSTQGVS